MKLSREEAIEKHRILWRRVAEELELKWDLYAGVNGVPVSMLKADIIAEMDGAELVLLNNCYLCEYAASTNRSKNNLNMTMCDYCPLSLPPQELVGSKWQDCLDNRWARFVDAVHVRSNKERSIELAKEIAELPEVEWKNGKKILRRGRKEIDKNEIN